VTVVKPGPLGPAAERLLAAVAARGQRVVEGPGALGPEDATVTLAVSDGPFVLDLLGLVRALGARRFRVLVLSRLGAHPDARAATLRRLWRLEEHVRGGGAPTLTLRLAPLVGPTSPLWRKLRARPALPTALARRPLHPVHEADAVETLVRALDGRAAWEGWYEVAGVEAVTLAELRERAAATRGPREGGAWEPSLEEMAEHRLAESEPWATWAGLAPTPLSALAGAGAA